MKSSFRALMLIFGLVLVGIFGYFWFFANSADNSEQIVNQINRQPDEGKNQANDQIGQQSEKYIEYSEANLKQAHGKRVLFFYANWCPTCRPVDAQLTANAAKIPEGITVIRVNYNDTATDQAEKELAAKYGVTYQHTFVQIDETGQEVTKWNGGGLEQLITNIK